MRDVRRYNEPSSSTQKYRNGLLKKAWDSGFKRIVMLSNGHLYHGWADGSCTPLGVKLRRLDRLIRRTRGT